MLVLKRNFSVTSISSFKIDMMCKGKMCKECKESLESMEVRWIFCWWWGLYAILATFLLRSEKRLMAASKEMFISSFIIAAVVYYSRFWVNHKQTYFCNINHLSNAPPKIYPSPWGGGEFQLCIPCINLRLSLLYY